MKKQTTLIQGILILVNGRFDEYDSHAYSLLLFIKEEKTQNDINVRYDGRSYAGEESEKECRYYRNFYSQFLRGVSKNDNARIQLNIEGGLEDGKMEYKGTGLIKMLNE